MAGSGSVCSVSFVPGVACEVEVTAAFDAQQAAGSDWGPTGCTAKLYMLQGGVYTYAEVKTTSTSRLRYSLQGVFSVAADAVAEFGLWCNAAGTAVITVWEADVRAALIKR